MTDLRKPLEGVPGLLLLAALVLFGATIGVSLALVFSWVEMKDSLANFLGGVVGAGLGAALAVMGAVYVQRRDIRHRLRVPFDALYTKVLRLSVEAQLLEFNVSLIWDPEPDKRLRQYKTISGQLDAMEDVLEGLSRHPELPLETNERVERLKSRGLALVRKVRRDATGVVRSGDKLDPLEIRKARALEGLSEVRGLIDPVYSEAKQALEQI